MEAFLPRLSYCKSIRKASCQGCRTASRYGRLPARVAGLQVEMEAFLRQLQRCKLQMEGFLGSFPPCKSGSKPSCRVGQAANSDGRLPRSVARLDFRVEHFLRRLSAYKSRCRPARWV